MQSISTPNGDKKIGVVSAHPKGFGFITTDEGEEFFVPPPAMRTLVPGDRVNFTVEAGSKPGQFQASRPVLLVREDSVWQGTVVAEDGRLRLVPDEACFVKLYLDGVDFIPADTVVSVRVAAKARGTLSSAEPVRLERVLGERTRKGFDPDYALAKFDFLPGFRPDVLEAAAKAPREVTLQDRRPDRRRDLRSTPFVTIDGESTRDFDDAVFVEPRGEGFLVQVAIVDVSHYVRPGSALDESAKKRATSVYLPGKTVPMLPEALSNGICSLNPGVERLAVVVSMQLDAQGTVTQAEHFRAVISSHARLTYRQVADAMQEGAAIAGQPPLVANLGALKSVLGLLLAQRKARGVLEFEDPEPSLRLNDAGEQTLVWEHRTNAHRLIEELMLLTNQSVAKMLFERHEEGFYRHQALPDPEDWTELVAWARARGYDLPDTPSLKAMSLLPAQARGAEELSIVNMHLRQVMNQAKYSTQNASHFSLGFASYAQFTSPVRRYADLCVHRLLLGEATLDDTLRDIAAQCSERARSARLAERHVWDRLKKRIFAREVPHSAELLAKCVSMSRRGMRVVLEAWQCSAFVPAAELMDEGYVWSMDRDAWMLEGEVVELGAQHKVRWIALEEELARVDLTAEFA